MAHYYVETCDEIIKKLINGNLIHADETKVSIDGKNSFVWVLTNMEYVYFFYTETRNGDVIREILNDFKGVLVSDFYAAYDRINCYQQKCLVHLIRDLNDDLLKNPYNQEFKQIITNFSNLLKPIVETVDRYGLKAHFLRKYSQNTETFFEKMISANYESEVAKKYQKRFKKYGNKLFTFLNYDGVPWNNNNAEHAIKAFAMLRRVFAGRSSARGIRDYLILLSICETCNYKGINVLDFLLSEKRDIDKFSEQYT